MTFDRGLVLALGVAAVSGACAAGSTGGPAAVKPSASGLPQVTCNGTAPAVTSFATSAQGALTRTMIPGMRPEVSAPLYQQALAQAQQGMAADAANPLYPFLAGEAYVGLHQLPEADQSFTKALQLCPGLADEITIARKAAFSAAFNAGVASLQANDTAAAMASFTRATSIYNRVPDAYFNLGVLYAQTGDLAHAVQFYREALAALGRAEPDTTAAGRTSAADTRANSIVGLIGAGGQYFQKENYPAAVDVFRTVTQLDPNSRDAWYNLGLALYKQNRWADLVPVAQRIVQIDPLNYNAQIILFNAYKGMADAAGSNRNDPNRQNALNTLAAADAMPVQVEGITVTNAAGSARISGTVVGAKAPVGRPVTLEFTVYGAGGRMGTQTVTVNAPAKDAKAPFELTLPTTAAATSFSYRLMP
jgi:tetratricopeptide (TPR) repeat protein